MTLVTIALPGTEITYTEGKWRLFVQLVRIGAEIELQLVEAEDEITARVLGSFDGKVEFCISMRDLIAMTMNHQKVDTLLS